MSLLEIVSIGSIFPILFLIVDPDVTVRESKTKQIYDFLGFTSHDAFFITMVALFCLFVVAIHVYKFWLHRYMFDFLARLQKHVEKTRHDMLLQTDPDQVT